MAVVYFQISLRCGRSINATHFCVSGLRLARCKTRSSVVAQNFDPPHRPDILKELGGSSCDVIFVFLYLRNWVSHLIWVCRPNPRYVLFQGLWGINTLMGPAQSRPWVPSKPRNWASNISFFSRMSSSLSCGSGAHNLQTELLVQEGIRGIHHELRSEAHFTKI